MGLNKLKKRIVVVKTTLKITNAMKLMASGKLQKEKNHYYLIKDYCTEYYDLISHLINNQQLSSKKATTLHIVITSYLGLCGGYNINILKQVSPAIRETDYLLQIGKRGHDTLSSKVAKEHMLKHNLVSSTVTYEDCANLALYIIDLYEQQTIDSICVHYTKFVNAITFIPSSLYLIPFDEKFLNHKQTAWNLEAIEFEPKISDIIKQVLPTYIATTLYACIVESSISENASRRNAMDSATDNATDLIDSLSLAFNRERQSKITNEITEIIAGSNLEKE